MKARRVLTPWTVTFLTVLLVVCSKAQSIALTSTPTEMDLAVAFAAIRAGNADPFEVTKQIGQIGDQAVVGLSGLVLPESMNTVYSDSVRACALYAAISLDAIGTQQSYAVLIHVAHVTGDPEIRARALSSLAGSYYYRLIHGKQNLIPDTNIVHLLWTSLDDSAIIRNTVLDIQQIALEGLKNWCGESLGGELAGINCHGAASTRGISEAVERESLWKDLSTKLKWNAQANHFEWTR